MWEDELLHGTIEGDQGNKEREEWLPLRTAEMVREKGK